MKTVDLNPVKDVMSYYRSPDGRFRIWKRSDGSWVAADTEKQKRQEFNSFVSALKEVEAWAAPPVVDEELTVTTAPRDYDWTGFGTREVEVVGESKGGSVVRTVATPRGFHTENQRARYRSGLHMALDVKEFEKVRDLTLK